MKRLLLFLSLVLPLSAAEAPFNFDLEAHVGTLLGLPEVKQALGDKCQALMLTSYFLSQATIEGANPQVENMELVLLTLTMNSIHWQLIERLGLVAELKAFLEETKIYENSPITDLASFLKDAQDLKKAFEAFFKQCSKKSELSTSGELLDLTIPEMKRLVHLMFKGLA
jgi:hypothetical protein